MNTIFQTLVHNQIETEGYKKVELVSVLQVRKQNAEKSVIQKLKCGGPVSLSKIKICPPKETVFGGRILGG